jgi:endonuclease/exonuclease/phosphatase family metal-dependent hydrolase
LGDFFHSMENFFAIFPRHGKKSFPHCGKPGETRLQPWFWLESHRGLAHNSGMKKPKTAPPPFRPLYAALLVAIGLCLWLLAQPRPGVRVASLKPVLAPAADAPAPAVPDRIRVATFNIERFTDAIGDGPDRTPERFIAQARGAADIIAEADPDILLVQEVENARVLVFLNEQLERPYPYIYVTDLRRSSGPRDPLNLGLLSRLKPWRVRQLGFHALVDAGTPTRGTLGAVFALGFDTMLMTYNIHLKSNYGEAPRNQAQRASALHLIGADIVSESFRNFPRATSTLVLGDTNVDPDSEAFAADPSLEPLAGSFADLWRGRPLEERTTIPTRHAGETGDPFLVFPPSAFDRVFASKNLVADGPWRVSPPTAIQRGADTANNLTPPGVDGHVSDHYLVYVDLTPNPDYVPPPPALYAPPE